MRNYTDHRVRDFETNISNSFYTKRLVVEDNFTALNHANTSTRIKSSGNGDSKDSRTLEVSLEIASHELRNVESEEWTGFQVGRQSFNGKTRVNDSTPLSLDDQYSTFGGLHTGIAGWAESHTIMNKWANYTRRVFMQFNTLPSYEELRNLTNCNNNGGDMHNLVYTIPMKVNGTIHDVLAMQRDVAAYVFNLNIPYGPKDIYAGENRGKCHV
eukprot:gene2788-3578_t